MAQRFVGSGRVMALKQLRRLWDDPLVSKGYSLSRRTTGLSILLQPSVQSSLIPERDVRRYSRGVHGWESVPSTAAVECLQVSSEAQGRESDMKIKDLVPSDIPQGGRNDSGYLA